MDRNKGDRALHFKRKSSTIDKKHLRVHRRSLDWKQQRNDELNKKRNLDDMSPLVEDDEEDRRLRSKENFNLTPSRRERLATPKKHKTPLHERKRDQLAKWRIERELKRKLESEKRKPLFKVSAIKHAVPPSLLGNNKKLPVTGGTCIAALKKPIQPAAKTAQLTSKKNGEVPSTRRSTRLSNKTTSTPAPLNKQKQPTQVAKKGGGTKTTSKMTATNGKTSEVKCKTPETLQIHLTAHSKGKSFQRSVRVYSPDLVTDKSKKQTKNSQSSEKMTNIKKRMAEKPVNITPTRGNPFNRKQTRSSARLQARVSTPTVPQEIEPGTSDVELGETDVELGETEVEPSPSDIELGETDVELVEAEVELGETEVEPSPSDIELGETEVEPSMPDVEPTQESIESPQAETDMEVDTNRSSPAEPQVTTTTDSNTPKSSSSKRMSVRRSLVKCITSPDSSVEAKLLSEPVNLDQVSQPDENSSDSEQKEQDEVVSSTNQETMVSPVPIARRTRKSMSSLEGSTSQSPLPTIEKEQGQTAPRRKSLAKGHKVRSPEEWVKLLAKSPMVEMSRRVLKVKTPPEKQALTMAFDFESMDFLPSPSKPQETETEEFTASDSFIELTANNKKTKEKESDKVEPDDEHTKVEDETCETAHIKEPEILVEPAIEPKEEPVHNVSYFRNLLLTEGKRLGELSNTWEAINGFGFELTEEVKGEIRTTVGQAQLLMDQRFKQFTGLVDDCEFKRGEKLTTCTDLQGFWDMIYYQVEDVDKKFEDLKKRKEANWEVEKTVTTTNTKSKKKGLPKPGKAKPAVKSKFAAFRAQMKKQKTDNSFCEGDNPVKVFDAGFFKVSSPQKTISPHCIIGSTPTKAPVNEDNGANHSSTPVQSPAPPVQKIRFINVSTPIPPLLDRTPRRKSYVPAVPSPLLCDITPGPAKRRRSYKNTPIPKKLLRRSEGGEVSKRSPIKTRRRSRSSSVVSSPQASQDTNKEDDKGENMLKYIIPTVSTPASLITENADDSIQFEDTSLKVVEDVSSTPADTSLEFEEGIENMSKSVLSSSTGNQKEKKSMKCVSFCDTGDISIKFDTEEAGGENDMSSLAQTLETETPAKMDQKEKKSMKCVSFCDTGDISIKFDTEEAGGENDMSSLAQPLETETPTKIDTVSEMPKSALKRSKTPQSGRRKSARLSVHFAPSPQKEELFNLQSAPVTPFNRNSIVPRKRVNSGSSDVSRNEENDFTPLNSPLGQKENTPTSKLNFTETSGVISTPLGNTNRKEVLDADLMSFSPR